MWITYRVSLAAKERAPLRLHTNLPETGGEGEDVIDADDAVLAADLRLRVWFGSPVVAPDRGRLRTVPFAVYGHVTGVAVPYADSGDRVVIAEEELGRRGAVDADGVDAVTIPVTC